MYKSQYQCWPECHFEEYWRIFAFYNGVIFTIIRELDVVNVITMIFQYLKYIVTGIKPGYPSAINESVSVLVLKKVSYWTRLRGLCLLKWCFGYNNERARCCLWDHCHVTITYLYCNTSPRSWLPIVYRGISLSISIDKSVILNKTKELLPTEMVLLLQ